VLFRMENATVVVYKQARGCSLNVPAARGTDAFDTEQTGVSPGLVSPACTLELWHRSGIDFGKAEVDILLLFSRLLTGVPRWG